ncbi:hypothetical protein [Phenylobacterium sp.]|uniref:glycosyltransferase n=1 Tax=Phenylobacterium sp. TaxID=1871053 RepID=UPI0025EA778A|nr:hypothetical protein [Phenylobacterium sp.]
MSPFAALARRFGLVAPLPRVRTEREIAERAFDAAYYLEVNTDVAAAGDDPLEHFLAFGWQEGRRPIPDFSPRDYLLAFPEAADSGVNPFVHWLTSGRPGVFVPEPPEGFRAELLARLTSVEDRIAAATGAAIPLAPPGDLAPALGQARGGLRDVHVTVSHDDFTAHVGGLQTAVRREAERLARDGRDHLHLYPAEAWPVVREPGDPGALGVVLNGRGLGFHAAATVADALARAASGPAGRRSLAVHSLLGHAADEIADIAAALGLAEGVFWLHDFASLCAGFHLLRNDVADCAAPPPGSAACGICVYGAWRARHLEQHARLFERLALTVAAPSKATLELWRSRTGLPAAAEAVLPHATLVPKGPAPVPRGRRPFRLAYAGLPVAHKGWPVFTALAARLARDPRYELVHLGVRRDPDLPVRFREVAAGPSRPLAMRDALAEEAADAVLVWPLCRETFSFVAYEAVAAGCAVITGPDSGNVQAFVREGGHGRVLEDEDALAQAFLGGDILDLARAARRPMLYDLAFSALSLDLPTRPAA